MDISIPSVEVCTRKGNCVLVLDLIVIMQIIVYGTCRIVVITEVKWMRKKLPTATISSPVLERQDRDRTGWRQQDAQAQCREAEEA